MIFITGQFFPNLLHSSQKVISMKKLLLFLILALTSCTAIPQTQVAGTVDLNNLQPLPTPEGHEAVPLRVAVAAVISPKGTVESYSPFLDYLEAKLNRKFMDCLGSLTPDEAYEQEKKRKKRREALSKKKSYRSN